MGESVVKLQERLSFQSTTTAGNQPTSPPIAERASLRPPPAAHLLGSETDLESVSAPTRTNDKPDLHNPEKGPCQRPSHSTHSAPYGHSRVTYADPEDDGEDDGPKEHAIWILVRSRGLDKDFFPLTCTESTDLPLCSVASSCTANSALHSHNGHATSVAPSSMLLREEIACLHTLPPVSFAATYFSARAHILILRHG